MDEKDKELNEQRRRIALLERRIKTLQEKDYNAYQEGYAKGRYEAYQEMHKQAESNLIEARQKVKR